MMVEMALNNMDWISNAFNVWQEIQEEGNICVKDIVVFIISDDDGINAETIEKISLIKSGNNANRLIVITDLDSVIKDDIHILCDDDLVFIGKTRIQIDNILKLYYIYPFSDRIIINDGREFLDADPYLLDGTYNICVSDVLDICFLRCRRKGIEYPVRRLSYRRIDWDNDSVRDQFRRCQNARNIVSELIEKKIIHRNKRIAVFACTETMKAVIDQLRTEGFDVDVILDNGSDGGSYCGIRVEKPEKYLGSSRDICILVTSRHYKEICEQLYFLGFEYGKTVFVAHSSYLEDKTLIDIEEEIKNEIRSGYKLYSNLKDMYPNHHFIIQPARGTGDMYLACLYLRKKTGSSKKLVYITKSAGYAAIAGTMDIQSETLDEKNVYSLITFLRSTGCDREDITVINTDFRQRCANLIWGFNGLDFNTFLQKTLYKVDYPVLPERIKQENSDQIFNDKGLKKGRTVLFSPYASASRMIDMDSWKRIAGFFADNGYSVCTNINGTEKPVSGTTGLSIPYSMILDFVDKAGFFVGVRSGLCDILSSTDAHMIVLYFDQPASEVGDFYVFFSLFRMGLRKENTLEIHYIDQYDTIDRISDYLNP